MTGDDLIALLGHSFEEPEVRAALVSIGVPWHPDLSADQDMTWLYAGALEIGFERVAMSDTLAPAIDPSDLVITQLCFYAPRMDGVGLPVPMPFGLSPGMGRSDVRRVTQTRGHVIRQGVRDVFDANDRLTVSISYNGSDGIDAVLLVWRVWGDGDVKKAVPSFAQIDAMFGMPWHAQAMRETFYSHFSDTERLSEVRRHGSLSLIAEFGLRLLFAESDGRMSFAACEFYRAGVRRSAGWPGELPLGLTFNDDETIVNGRIDSVGQSITEGGQEKVVRWSCGERAIVVTFDLVVNRIASVIWGRASYWRARS